MSDFTDIYNNTVTNPNLVDQGYTAVQNPSFLHLPIGQHQFQDAVSQHSDNSSTCVDTPENIENQIENGFVISPSRRKTYPALRSKLFCFLDLTLPNSSHPRD
jgi:hypothetical protein